MTPSQEHELTQAVKTEAQHLGFFLAGVTHPAPTPHFPQYQSWLDAGRHAGMAYLASKRARTLRRDPALVLPGCRSILVLGIPYPSPATIPTPSDGSPYGRVAAYAWGDDYHRVLPPRLQALGEWITQRCGAGTVFKEYTDTGPILERDLAQRAGLGWIGKNTCLIHPRLGSYFFLAELFLNIALEEDAPFTEDRCGSCQRCIQACPTSCILPDRTLDARRCIACLTIEHKGEFPPELRSPLGAWIFGCDLCQMACPWNRKPASPQGNAAFAPRPGTAFPTLNQELQLSPQAFEHKFHLSPIQRAHWRGYMRNLAAAADNVSDMSSLPALEKLAFSTEDEVVRAAAHLALTHLQVKKL